jgi:hypothetical protein
MDSWSVDSVRRNFAKARSVAMKRTSMEPISVAEGGLIPELYFTDLASLREPTDVGEAEIRRV